MGVFNQLANVVEWEEFRDDVIFWKWSNKELKKSSRLIIRPGQDAIFLYNGRIEGIFTEEGNYEVESQIIPFLSSLKGFKFGFNSGLRAEVLFVNTKEFTVKWGTKSSVLIPTPGMPGGLPIRAFGTFQMKVSDYVALIDKIAGVRREFTVDDVRERVMAEVDQLLMRWIMKEGRDMFNLQANAREIGQGICEDLDMELRKSGLAITNFTIASVNYPEEVQQKINQNASYAMVGDLDRYQRVAMMDAMQKGGDSAAGAAMGSAAGMAAGFAMANQMFGAGHQQPAQPVQAQQSGDAAQKFCMNCGAKMPAGAKFCASCGSRF